VAEEIRGRIAGGEGRRLEFKRGLPAPAKVARTLAAFANGVGGLLLVGVEDDGALCGAPDPSATMAELERLASERVEPPLQPWILGATLDGRRLVVVFVASSPAAPHRARLDDGQLVPVLRRAASTCEVDEEALVDAVRARAELSSDERTVLAWLRRATARDRAARTTLGRVARATGLARSRVRRVLAKLESHGVCLGVGPDAASRTHVAP
jgi:predicted HTH transcriptional regulator